MVWGGGGRYESDEQTAGSVEHQQLNVLLRFAERIPGAKLATLPGVKHDGPLRRLKEFSKMIVDFVEQH